jgi:hypothetical protein
MDSTIFQLTDAELNIAYQKVQEDKLAAHRTNAIKWNALFKLKCELEEEINKRAGTQYAAFASRYGIKVEKKK